MIYPASQISKLLIAILIILFVFFIFMDINLYFRIKTFPLERTVTPNTTLTYKDISWVSCDISPLCDVTTKALLLDHVNHYLFGPLVKLTDRFLDISGIWWITPNAISFFHVFVAVVSGKCISSDILTYRRVGVVLFEFRTFLDDFDGHVARVRKNVKGERSEIGTSGYYIDGLCDGLGCIALLVGAFMFLKNNPPRRGYMQLPTVSGDKEGCLMTKGKVTINKIVKKMSCFTIQLLLSSTAWNRYIMVYQDMLERTNVTALEFNRQNVIFSSTFFFFVAWLWRIVNVHNMVHFMLLAVFCDKLWEFLSAIQYFGFAVLLTVICVTELHVLDTKSYIFQNPMANSTNV